MFTQSSEQHLAGGFGIVQVFGHGAVGANPDHANLPIAEHLVVLASHLDGHTRQRSAAVDEITAGSGVIGRNGGRHAPYGAVFAVHMVHAERVIEF